jgi:phosphotransferase system enzyme I (PtsI)
VTFAIQGICAAKGIAIGRISMVDRGQIEVSEYTLDTLEVDSEVERFRQAVETARLQLSAVRQQIPAGTPAEIAAFLDAHLLMLEDSALTRAPVDLIRDRHWNAEWALKVQRDTLVSVFEEMEDAYLRTRKDDVDHVVARIQRILLRQDRPRHDAGDGGGQSGAIVFAHDVTPADAVLLQQQGIRGFITEYGGPTSHTAILARSLHLPALVGLHQARPYLRDNDLAIIDGRAGVVLVDPDDRLVRFYQRRQRDIQRHRAARQKLAGAPARTADGQDIALQANIELPEDVQAARRAGAAGVGLYRTEYLFMNRDAPPGEEEQYEAYASVVRAMRGAPVTIRTLDIGADKGIASAREGGPAPNPALGLRAIRLCLREPTVFRPQLRAILRASVHGPVRLLVPMMSGLQELHQVLALIKDARRSLTRESLAFDPAMPIGAMIEVPAAAVCADLFARRLGFLSIGTNDLIQYTLAIDRVDDEVNYLYDPLNPAVLRLIHLTIRAGQRTRVPVAMCGEMAGNPRYTRLLLGMGLREFSVPPNALLEVKQVVATSDAGALAPMVRRLMRTADPRARVALFEAINNASTSVGC